MHSVEILLLITALTPGLGLPRALEFREQIITAVFGAAAFSIFVQGVTMTLLLRGLRILTSSPTVPDLHRKESKDEL